jgi:hypothetical protein
MEDGALGKDFCRGGEGWRDNLVGLKELVRGVLRESASVYPWVRGQWEDCCFRRFRGKAGRQGVSLLLLFYLFANVGRLES